MMSRLPNETAYWEALTERLVEDAAGRLSASRGGVRWWSSLARYATPLLIGAAAAVIASFLWLPETARTPPVVASPASVYGLTPNDPLGVLFVSSTEAPTMATVMATSTLELRP